MGQQALVQKTIESATQPGNAGAVAITTFIAGISTYAEKLTPIAGLLSCMLGGTLTVLLIANAIKKRREESKLAKLKRESEHLDIEIKKKQLRDM
jgi:hypothetical protein